MRTSSRESLTAYLAGLAFAALAGCGADREPGHDARVGVSIAPLSLAGLARACYDLHVANGLGETVWSRGDPDRTLADGDIDTICSDEYGNAGGGDITYLGPCDATEPAHTVTIFVDTLATTDSAGNEVALDDWQDPCPNGCALPVTCAESRDSTATFDLVVLRSAGQGFFDVSVDLEDVFCSAKVDCTYDDAGVQPIELLHSGPGVRGATAVMAVACTAGASSSGTTLHMNGPRVECAGVAGPMALPLTCDAGGEMFGGVYGATALGPRLLPTRWGAAAADVLPVGGDDGGIVLQRLDADHLLGFVYRGNPGHTGTHALATWARSGSGWSLESTASMPEDVGYELQPSYWDAATGIFWFGGTAQNGSPAVFFPRTVSGPFEPGRFIHPPSPYARCELSSIEGPFAIGRCFRLDWEPGNVPAVRWSVADQAHPSGEALPDPPFPGGGARYTVTWASGLSDGNVLGSVEENASGLHRAVFWRELAGAWTMTLLGPAPSAEPFYDGEVDDVVMGPDHVLVYDPVLDTFVQSPTLTAAAPVILSLIDGYDARLGLVYGRMATTSNPAPHAFVAPLTGPAALVATPLPVPPDFAPVPGAEALTLLGDVSTADATRIVYRYGFTTPRFIVWELERVAGEAVVTRWFETAFDGSAAPPAGLQVQRGEGAELAYRPFRSTCDELIGADTTTGITATRWRWPSTNGETSEPEHAPNPAVFAAGLPPWSRALDPTIAGNAWDPPHTGDPVWQYAVDRGQESLACGTGSCKKLYWSIPIGFDTQRRDCRLRAEATVAEAPGLAGGSTGLGRVYPVVTIDLPLTGSTLGADGSARVCRRHPLNGGAPGVITSYTTPSAPATFCHRFDGEAATSEPGCTWP